MSELRVIRGGEDVHELNRRRREALRERIAEVDEAHADWLRRTLLEVNAAWYRGAHGLNVLDWQSLGGIERAARVEKANEEGRRIGSLGTLLIERARAYDKERARLVDELRLLNGGGRAA